LENKRRKRGLRHASRRGARRGKGLLSPRRGKKGQGCHRKWKRENHIDKKRGKCLKMEKNTRGAREEGVWPSQSKDPGGGKKIVFNEKKSHKEKKRLFSPAGFSQKAGP